jgi:hypothetical protein
MYSWWWVQRAPETCRVILQENEIETANCCISLDTHKKYIYSRNYSAEDVKAGEFCLCEFVAKHGRKRIWSFHCCVCVWRCFFLLIAVYNEAFSCWDYITSIIDEWMNRCADVGLGGVILVGENRSFLRKTCPSSASSSKNFHIDYLGIKSDTPWWDASDCQKHDRARKMLNND